MKTRLMTILTRIDPATLVLLSSVCDAHWLHRCLGGC
jgi:hypothetical protein